MGPVSQCRNNSKILEVADDDSLDSTSIDDESVDSTASADSNKSVDSASLHDNANSISSDKKNKEDTRQRRLLKKKLLSIQKKEDVKSIWICDECYRRFEQEEDALNCEC